jgi:hypothetical protein
MPFKMPFPPQFHFNAYYLQICAAGKECRIFCNERVNIAKEI